MILNINELIKRFGMNITGVIHVGAHFGEEDSLYRSLGINKIHYFEPVKKTFEILKRNVIGGENIFLHNCAIGSEQKSEFIYVEDEDKFGASSILEPSVELKSHISFSSREEVEVKRLDDFNILDCNFLNIDCQGYEYEVLLGATNTLQNIEFVMLEVNRITKEKPLLYLNTKTIEHIEFLLGKHNFSLVDVSWAGGSWGDAIFIKNKRV